MRTRLCGWSLCAAVALAIFFPRPVAGRDLSTTKTLYVVGTAHLDSDWRWTVKPTILSYIPKTLRANFRLFDLYPHYVFSFEGAVRYMWAKEYYPDDFARLKSYLLAGRWAIASASVDAGDVNIPSPESIIRHALYSNQFFRREFGKGAGLDIFLPDCFGFGYALPTIAAHCGLRGFSTQKLIWAPPAIPVPFDVGRWEGPDGKSVVAALKPSFYVSSFTGIGTYAQAIDSLGQSSQVLAGYRYHGTGDTGGSPSEASVAALEKEITTPTTDIQVLSAPSDQMFRDLSTEQMSRLPVHKGELLMRTHGTGCYTSHSEMKLGNEQCEVFADASEGAAVPADWLGGLAYPRDTFSEAWVRFLWHHHHDDITGTSIPEVYPMSWNDQILSQNQFAGVMTHAVAVVARAMDTRAEGTPLLVYNPLAVAREDLVEAIVRFPADAPPAVRVVAPDGSEAPAQIDATDGRSALVVFLARVAAHSFTVYDVRPAAAAPAAGDLTVGPDGLENGRYRVKVNAQGDVASVVDKAAGNRDLLAGPVELQFLTNRPGPKPAWQVLWSDVNSPPRPGAMIVKGVKLVERGPARAALEITREREGSTLVQTISLGGGGAADRVEIDSVIAWNTPHTLLKAAFPLSVANQQATYDLGIGTIARGNDTAGLYEVPAQHWADLTAADGSYGVSVLSDVKYGWDKPADGLLRLSLIHSPDGTSAYPDQDKNELGGRHRMRYALFGHQGGWREDTVWQAARMERRLLAFQPEVHQGALGKTFSFLSLDQPAVAVRAVKKAEQSEEIIVRVQETAGKAAGGVHLTFAAPITAAREVNGVEDPVGPAVIDGGRLVFDLTAYQPRTFAVALAPPATAIAAATWQPIALPFDTDVVSFRANKADGDMDGRGNTIAGELFPATVRSGGLSFSLGGSQPGQANAVACAAQKVALPAGDFNRVTVLAAAIGGDQKGTFQIDDQRAEITVHDWTAKVGSWRWGSDNQEGTKRAEVAWVGTHLNNRDNDGNAEAYEFSYLFRYDFPAPRGARQLTLPQNAKIRVFGVSIASTVDDGLRPATPDFPIVPTTEPPPNLSPPPPASPPVAPGPMARGCQCALTGGGRAGAVLCLALLALAGGRAARRSRRRRAS